MIRTQVLGKVVALLVCTLLAQPSGAEEAFRSTNVVLYNKLDVFISRAPSAKVLGAYIERIIAKAAPLWHNDANEAGRRGFIAVAIRPDRTVKLWVDVEEEFQPEITNSLEKAMRTIGVPQVKNGPIAFAVHFNLWGGTSKPTTDTLQIPQLWQQAAETEARNLLVPDDFLSLVWKETPAPDDERSLFVPEGYELQELKPIAGKILRPTGWFYTEGHREHTLMWTISKEDPMKGPYETGVRIQFFAGLHEKSGESPKDFVQSILDRKKMTAEVISQRPEQTQGTFTRIGLEVEQPHAPDVGQKTDRVLYSCFWSNEADLVVIVISGTTSDLWEQYSDTFDAMSGFELIDMTTIGRDQTKASSAPR